MHFVAVIEKEPQTLYGGWFPDVPGAISAGRTLDECVASARTCLREWAAETLAHGEHLPPARALQEIQADRDVRAARRRGAVFVAVPLKLWG
ncbi:type II toxin-antitoxin system HicB family antitoxin [Bosea sp. RAF48]|uniref:type II toxin-antitoxin system HicB family antitoxin n=1 Tax=Bosea sp. RAF48 TaxID=3237480 RepID=UPI003F93362A